LGVVHDVWSAKIFCPSSALGLCPLLRFQSSFFIPSDTLSPIGDQPSWLSLARLGFGARLSRCFFLSDPTSGGAPMSPEGTRRKLTAILSADVKGYSRLMEDNEEATVTTLTTYRQVIAGVVEKHEGRVVDAPGDNVLAEFTSVVEAMRGAVEIQEELRARNADLPDHRRMEFRIGINLGDVIEEEGRLYGDGVNIAARVESLADAGGICLTGSAYQQVKNKLSLDIEYLGEHEVKNISEPVPVYRLLMGAGTVGARVNREPQSLPLPDKPSIAVLPFVNISGDPEQEYFADGMTDDLITDLSKISGLFVIARNSAFSYKGKSPKVQQVSRELGVRFVVEGSARRAGDQVRINAQLVDAKTGGHLWAERYDGNMADIFGLQDKINQKIVAALAIQLTPREEQDIVQRGTHNTVAYDAVLKAWEHFERLAPNDLAKAVPYYEKAIELDPNFGRAYEGLAIVYYWAMRYSWPEALNLSGWECFKRSRHFLQMAAKIDVSSGHLMFAMMYRTWRLYDKAVAEAERALQLAPNDPETLATIAFVLVFAGRSQEAIEYATECMRRDPHSTGGALPLLGMAYFCLGQFDRAEAFLERSVRLNPKSFWGFLFLASAYGHLGRDQQASAALEGCRNALPSWPLNLRAAVAAFPFKDLESSDRFAEGLLKAGLSGEPGGYCKFLEQNRLTEKEIRDLVAGRTLNFRSLYGQAWQQDFPGEGEFGSPGHAEGRWWIESDLLCVEWDRLYADLSFCATVFRNPDGTAGIDEYMTQNQVNTDFRGCA
jgi:TolB-like protein